MSSRNTQSTLLSTIKNNTQSIHSSTPVPSQAIGRKWSTKWIKKESKLDKGLSRRRCRRLPRKWETQGRRKGRSKSQIFLNRYWVQTLFRTNKQILAILIWLTLSQAPRIWTTCRLDCLHSQLLRDINNRKQLKIQNIIKFHSRESNHLVITAKETGSKVKIEVIIRRNCLLWTNVDLVEMYQVMALEKTTR